MSKRRRFEVPAFQTKRPIDKSIRTVVLTGLDATDQNTVLVTATFPCTVTGLRWDINVIQEAGTATCFGSWVIVKEDQGQSVDTLNVTNAGSLYDPEQNVMAFGNWLIDNNVQGQEYRGTTKSMRKLKVGDRLIFIAVGTATNTSQLRGQVQFFCKT